MHLVDGVICDREGTDKLTSSKLTETRELESQMEFELGSLGSWLKDWWGTSFQSSHDVYNGLPKFRIVHLVHRAYEYEGTRICKGGPLREVRGLLSTDQ